MPRRILVVTTLLVVLVACQDGPVNPTVSFFAYLSADIEPTAAIIAPVAFDQELHDVGSNHNSGVFVAPVDGVYNLAAHVTASGKGWIRLILEVAGRELMSVHPDEFYSGGPLGPLMTATRTLSITVTVPLSAGESVRVLTIVADRNTIHGIDPDPQLDWYGSFFSGHLVHALSP